ncbi:MAG: ubiquitin-like small modifier protein 1 [Acidimicrobiales bacterium]
MSVDVRLPTQLRSQAGGRSVVQVTGSTVGEVLSSLVAGHPGMAGQLLADDGTLQKFVNVYVNDDDVRYLSLLDTAVKDGDEVSILPAVAGG